jgi:CHAT domain-containing protein/tetratricopeptide (TPR) repeat protein
MRGLACVACTGLLVLCAEPLAQRAGSADAAAGGPPRSLAAAREALSRQEELRASGDLAAARAALAGVLAALDAAGGEDPRAVAELYRAVVSAANRVGALETALRAAKKRHALLSAAVQGEDPLMQSARADLGAALGRLGRLEEALAHQREIVAIYERHPPADAGETQHARLDLSVTLGMMGQLERSRELQEAAVAAAESLAEDHPARLRARELLGGTLAELGRFGEALPMLLAAIAARERGTPVDEMALARARSNVGVVKLKTSDPAGAAELFAQVLEVFERRLPADHPQLQVVRLNLASAKAALDDPGGALVLHEQALASLQRTLPATHPHVLLAKRGIANAKSALGDADAARALLEEVVASLEEQFDESHPELLGARQNLADVLSRAGATATTRSLHERIFSDMRRSLPDGHSELQYQRINLGLARLAEGDFGGALALLEEAREKWQASVADDAIEQRVLLKNMLRACLAGNLVDRVPELCSRYLRCWVAALTKPTLAPREAAEQVVGRRHALCVHLSAMFGAGDAPPIPEIAPDVLVLAEHLRGVAVRSARRARKIMAAGKSEELAGLSAELAAASAAVAKAAAAGADSPDGRAAALAAAVFQRDGIARRIAALAAQVGGRDPAVDAAPADLAARLPAGHAAATILAYHHHRWAGGKEVADAPTELCALVLDRSGRIATIHLGSYAAIDELAERARQRMSSGTEWSDPVAKSADEAPLRELRARVLDPILTTTAGARVLHLSLDEVLALVPLDALPTDAGEPVGAGVQIRVVASLLDLLQPRAETTPNGGLVLVGALDYGAAEASSAPGAVALARGGAPAAFAPLPGTKREVEELDALFAAGERAAATVLSGGEGTKAELARRAPGARFLHLATHGWFAHDDTEAGSIDDPADDETVRLSVSNARSAAGLSPFVLTGLALAAANERRDAQGRSDGVITAEEISALDLTRCELVVLSACVSAVGVRRVHQGCASLRTALLAAGARCVVTSFWRVPDEVTCDLMREFYRRMWTEGKDAHRALWEARMAIRSRPGARFRDWAGWVAVGG